MSFATFLKQVSKMLFGYGVGVLLMVGGVMMWTIEGSGIGALVAIAGFILLLFGVYNEQEL